MRWTRRGRRTRICHFAAQSAQSGIFGAVMGESALWKIRALEIFEHKMLKHRPKLDEEHAYLYSRGFSLPSQP